MAKVFISIGSNINKRENITGSVRALRKHFGKLRLSPVYQSDAVGFEGDTFYNMVVALETTLSPQEVAGILSEIELAHDRTRGPERFCSRTLDLDQLLYDDLTMDADGVRLPHEDIVKYTFVLRPLADLAGDIKHVLEGKTYAQLWEERAAHMQPALVKVELPELDD